MDPKVCSIFKVLPVHRSTMLWQSRDMSCVCNRSIDFFRLYKSLQSPREWSGQLMHFYCRVKTSSNEKWRVWIIQTSPDSPSSVHNTTEKSKWSRLFSFLQKLFYCYVEIWIVSNQYNHFISKQIKTKVINRKELQATYVCSLIIWRCLPSSPHTRHVQSSPAVTIN